MNSPFRSDKVAQDSRRFYSVAEVARMFGMAQMTFIALFTTASSRP